MTPEEFKILLNADKETEHLEFKEAKNQFNFDQGKKCVLSYCTALGNELGGKLVLGVSNKLPRRVVGTSAFPDVTKFEKDIYNRLHRRIKVEELIYDDKRVLILHVPSRPIGEVLKFDGRAFMRVGDSLEVMSTDYIKKIINEAIHDYSSKIVEGATIEDLSKEALKELKKLLKQSVRVEKNISGLKSIQLLRDLNLMDKDKITIAALVLLGKENPLKKYLPHAEIRFGYKVNESEIRNQDSAIYIGGYLHYYDKLFDKINSRNLSAYIPLGFRVLEKKVFDEETIREAINNAIIHRDYSEPNTILIIQTQKKILIKSPGGLPKGVTPENIMDETKIRNKLIADVLYKCEFVEQFGNGVNLMIKNQLSLGKNIPDYSRSNEYSVSLEIDGTIQDLEFAKYVYLVANKKGKLLNDKELYFLYKIKNGGRLKSNSTIQGLLDLGLIEYLGRNKYILSKDYYQKIDKRGEYTRRRGLDNETNKALIITHLKNYKNGYMKDFQEVLPNVPRSTINAYLSELRDENKVELVGNPKVGRGPNRAYWKLR